MKITSLLKIDMQANLEEKNLSQIGYSSHINSG